MSEGKYRASNQGHESRFHDEEEEASELDAAHHRRLRGLVRVDLPAKHYARMRGEFLSIDSFGDAFVESKLEWKSGHYSANLRSVKFSANGYGAARELDARSKLTEQELEDVDPTQNLFDPSAGMIDAVEWLTRLDYSAHVESEISTQQRERRDQVQDVLQKILPEVEGIRFSKPTSKRIVPKLEFKTPYGWVPLRGLSNGYQTMISWVVDFAARLFYRYPDSPDPLAEPAVCLVDEIDLHLHPRWQREIMSFLSERFPKTQFIATAHSPLIVQAAETVNANVAVLRREGDHVVIDNHPQSVRGWRVDQILASDLFGEIGPWPPEIQKKMDERSQILAKPTLSAKDKQRLAMLEHDLKDAPVGETPQQIEMMKALQRYLDVSGHQKASGS